MHQMEQNYNRAVISLGGIANAKQPDIARNDIIYSKTLLPTNVTHSSHDTMKGKDA